MIKLFILYFIEILAAILLLFTCEMLIAVYKLRSYKPKKCKKIIYKKSNKLDFLFHQLPEILVKNIKEYDKNKFKYYGIIIFYGPQGSGKTMAMTHYINKIACEYPDVNICTNYRLLIQDFNLENWQPILDIKYKNSPSIFAFDEISTWFNGRNWQSFPKELLTEIAYNRKNQRIILGTAQTIASVDVAIRRQCNSGEFRRCFTLLGFIGLVVRFRPEFDIDGNLKKAHFLGFYTYIQNDTLRYLYDTFSVVDEMSKNIERNDEHAKK